MSVNSVVISSILQRQVGTAGGEAERGSSADYTRNAIMGRDFNFETSRETKASLQEVMSTVGVLDDGAGEGRSGGEEGRRRPTSAELC